MKRIISVALAVCMLLSVMVLTACSETPASLVNGALAKMAALESVEAKVDAEIKMSMMGIDMAIPIDMHLMMNDVKSENPVGSIKTEMSFMGETVAMDMYMDGQGWAYMTVAGESYKVNTEAAEEELPMSSDTVVGLMIEIPEELFANAVIEKNDDGSKSVDLVVTAEQASQLFGDALNGLTSSMGGAVTVKDITLEITVKGGYVVEYDMEVAMDITIEGIAVAATMDMDIDYINPGKDVTVTPPAGYESFPVMGE